MSSLLAGGGSGGAQLAHGKATTFSWKPNLENVGVVDGYLPSSLTSRAGMRYLSSQATSEPPKMTYHMASKRVTRKVQRIPPTSTATSSSGTPGTRTAWSTSAGLSKPPGATGASTLITTSSWRAGKELTDKILKGDEDRERRHTYDYRSDEVRRKREKEGNSPQSSVASECGSHLGSSLENISGVSSTIDLHVSSERGRMDTDEPRRTMSQERQGHSSPSQKEKEKTDGGGVEEGSCGGRRVALDVAGLLEDMESPVPTEGGRGRGDKRAKLVQTRSTSGGPSSKKPRYSVPGE